MSTTESVPSVKQGDATVLKIDLGINAKDTGYLSGVINIRDARTKVIFVTAQALRTFVTGSDTNVYYDMPATDTTVARECECEVMLSPGPHTYPSDGYMRFNIKAKIS